MGTYGDKFGLRVPAGTGTLFVREIRPAGSLWGPPSDGSLLGKRCKKRRR